MLPLYAPRTLPVEFLIHLIQNSSCRDGSLVAVGLVNQRAKNAVSVAVVH